MAKDYSANPVDVKNFTQTSEVNLTQDIQDYSEFLPAINRSESLTRFFGSTVNQLLSSGSTQSIDAYWGRIAGRNYNPDNELFQPETTDLRLNYQFQPGVVSRDAGTTQTTTSYINWLSRLESLGSDLNNHDRLFSEPGYVLDLPINADMFTNYANYYWLEGQMPLIEITPTLTDPIDIDTILQRSQYTTPVLANYRTVEFVTGLRVKFTGIYATSTSGNYAVDAIYYVENVGGRHGIKLIEIVSVAGVDLFPTTSPYEIESREGWDTLDWDSNPWDGTAIFEEYNVSTTALRQDLTLNKSYIVMERWAQDKNPWARTNKWFSIHALRIATEFNNLELEAYLNARTRADRPIIEFNANMELIETGKTFVETVDYAVSLDQLTDMLSGRPTFAIDSQNEVQDGDIVLVSKRRLGGIELIEFNSDFNADYDSGVELGGPFGPSFNSAFQTGVQTSFDNDAFIISGVGTSITLTPYNTYSEDEFVIVSKGTEKGTVYFFKDGDWSVGQNKTTRGTAPLFNLYDDENQQLSDFENTDFGGDKIFFYQVSPSGNFDRELGFNPSFTDQGSFSNYQFTWSLSNIRYNQNVTVETQEEIPGYYCFKNWVEDEYYNGWSNIRGGQRVPIIQTQIYDGVTPVTFELGTSNISRPTEYTVTLDGGKLKWFDHSYIDRTPIGYANPDFIWKYDTDYIINDLISVDGSKLEMTDPYGNADANITYTGTSTLKTLTVDSAYEYEKVLYRRLDDPTVFGEIFLSNENQNRYLVTINGQRLIDGVDFTFSGSTITIIADLSENDVIELLYVADADLVNVVYDVAPVHFYNSVNKPFNGAGYDDLIGHISRQNSAMPGYEGSTSGLNNYHKTLRQHTYDGLIRQQIFKTANIQYLLDQENINPIRALKNFSTDYSNFKQFFKNKVKQLWQTETWNSVRTLVDRAISDINIGKDKSFKYANSDMAYYKQSRNVSYVITDSTVEFDLPEVINRYGNTQNHVQVYLLEFDGGLGKIVERQLINGVDYNVDVTKSKITLVTTAVSGATLTIRWYSYDQVSNIPFSAVKLGFFKPTQVEVVGNELIGHDGARHTLTNTELFDLDSGNFDVVSAALLDFELRVFNNLVSNHFVTDRMAPDMATFYPNAINNHSYSISDINMRLDDWYNRYANRNNITEIDVIDYDVGNEFTWNYSTVGPNLGSWRSLYTYEFGTDRPDTHPWEMLGHNIKPIWWDTTYSWTAGALRTALLNALRYGVTGNETTPDYVDTKYARPNYDWANNVLVSDDGIATLNGPVTAAVVTSPSSIDASRNFVFGDWSEIENDWRKSSEYKFALAEVYLQLKPYRVHETFWTLDRWRLNSLITQEQWIDPTTCVRDHNTEIHNQQITSGIISRIDVESAGTGYYYLNLDFSSSSVCYQNAQAVASTTLGAVQSVAVLDPGRGFVTDPEVTLDHPIAANGAHLIYSIDFDYTTRYLGFNTLPAEEYRTNTEYTNTLASILENLEVNYMLHVGGFTDNRILSIEIDGDYQSGLVRVPESSYDILIDRNAPNKIVYYSGVKIEKVSGQGYIIDGYNLDSKFFNFLVPSTSGQQTSIQVGNSDVIKHLNWRNEVNRIPYRSVIRKRQDLYQFLLGLGKYYESVGFVTTSRWEEEARLAIIWALDVNQTVPYYVNGIDDVLIFNQGERGVVQTIDVNYDGVPNVIDQDFKNIRRNEMLVLRNDTTTEFSVKSGVDRIYGLGVRVVEFEHIVTLNNVTTFNDPIYQPELGLGQNRVRLVGERTRNWNGRVEAPGYLVQDRGLILNIENSVHELETEWVTSESKALERLTRQTIGYNVGYSKPTYMTNMFITDKSAYRFEKGLRKYKGTAAAIGAMARNKNIFGSGFDHELYEEWMVRLGDYGDTSENNPLQFSVVADKIKSDPQHFRFNSQFVSDKNDDLIIDMSAGSADAISGNYNMPFNVYPILPVDNTRIDTLEQYQKFTRDAGLPLVDEIDYFLGSIDDIGDIYDPTQEYALIPNWSDSVNYVQGDVVRRFGKVRRLLLESTGLTTINDDIVVRGTQVFPLVPNGLTFIANGTTVTFAKSNSTTTYTPIQIDGTVTSPTIPSGDTLIIDGVNINFIKTSTVNTYGNIILDGNVTSPTIVNTPSKTVTIYYANTVIAPLTEVIVNFNELSTTLTMQTILRDAFIIAGFLNPTPSANSRIAALSALQSAYIGANSIASWETFINNYYDNVTNPDMFVNPEYLGIQVAANPGAAWETAARALLQLDLDDMSELAGTHIETEASMVLGRASFNNATTFDADIVTTNNLFDPNVTLNDANENLADFVSYVETNGGVNIANGAAVPVTNLTEYVTDDVTAIVDKINAKLLADGAPSSISASAAGSIVTITRTSNLAGYRLGVSTDADLGFTSDDNDVVTQGTTTVVPVDLTLTEAVNAINNASVTGVIGQEVSNRLRIISTNPSITVGNGTANNDFGISSGIINAVPNITTVLVDLQIADVVTQINAAGIVDLVATQINGVLLLTYSDDTLIIGAGTANATLGIFENTFEATTNEVQNTFVDTEWETISEPANFNIWTIDNIGSNPVRPINTNSRYDVLQTIDFQIGVLEICAGSENGDDALIYGDTAHTLSVGEYVLIINSTCIPSVDGIHQVTGIQDDQGFYIDRYIDSKGFTGKVLPLRSVRFPNSDVAQNAINDSNYVQGGLGLRNGTFMYVDEILDENGFSLKYGGVYTVERSFEGTILSSVRNENGKTNNSNIKNGILFSGSTGETIIQYEVYDPLKGLIPGIADREIDIRSDVDFAYYNNSTDPNKELHNSNLWGNAEVGKVWWNLRNAIYLNYDQSVPEYRQAHWGELFPTSTIDIYEWTKSPVTPDEYMSAVTGGTVIDGIELTGTPYAIVDQYGENQYDWSEELVFNNNTNQIETYYYFWVKDKTTVPTIERNYSVTQLADVIIDPNSLLVDWLAATSENTMLISSLDKTLGYRDLVMKINLDTNSREYHQEYVMLAENDPSLIIPEWLHISLRDSLAGFTSNTVDYEYTLWDAGTSYVPDNIIISSLGKYYRNHTASLNNDPDADVVRDYWTLMEADYVNPDGVYNGVDIVRIAEPQVIPDRSLHPLVRYGLETRPHQIWFKNIEFARKAAVEKINDQLLTINLIDSDINWRDEFDRSFFVGDLEYDVSAYWNFFDWTASGYIFNQGAGDYFVTNIIDLSTLAPNENEIAQVEKSNDTDGRNRRSVWRYEGGEWILVYKEKATIQFSSLIWDNQIAQTGWDIVGWDTTTWDKSSSAVMVEIFNSFYNRIWVGKYSGYYADLWFNMAKYVLSEQQEVDWLFKSSYFKLIVEDELEKQYNKFFTETTDDFFDFVNTIKPFSSKMRDGIIRKVAGDDVSVTSQDAVEVRIQTNPVDDTIDELLTRSFRLSVGKNSLNYSSQIVNNQKVLLAINIDSETLAIPVLNLTSNTLPETNGAIWINGERIEYTGQTVITAEEIDNDFVLDFADSISMLTGITRGTQGTFARPHQYADIIEDESLLTLVENTSLSDYGTVTDGIADNFAAAWNEYGDGLLDINNLNSNSATIRSRGFGTIDAYGDILYAQWLALQVPAAQLESLQQELEELIEVYWAQIYPSLTADLDFITIDTEVYTVDGAG